MEAFMVDISRTIITKYFLLAILGLQFSGLTAHMEPIKKDGRYFYPDQADLDHEHINLKKALSFLGGKLLSPQAWAQKINSLFYPPTDEKIDANAVLNPTQTIPKAQCMQPTITWIGHATFLIQANGINILTDPIFGDVKMGPFTLTKRAIKPGVEIDNLPVIHAIVISHNHSDHTDTNSLQTLAQKYDPIVYVPEGNKELVASMGFTRVIEKTWWEHDELTLNDQKLTISCLPAYHWSARFSLGSYRKALWSSWMISTDAIQIYFAGDTAYGPHFKEIGAQFPSIDIALLPIAPTHADENEHNHSHVNAREAVDAFIDLNAQHFIPMHYGTFFMSKNSLTYPLETLAKFWQKNQELLKDKNVLMAQCGKAYIF